MNPGLGWLTGFLKTLLLHHDLDAGLSLQSYYTQLCCNRLPVPQNGLQEVKFMYDVTV